MTGSSQPVVVVIASSELRFEERVWGTGGWIPPTEREGLDWLTLVAFMGWGVTTISAGQIGERLSTDTRWLIIATDPSSVDDEAANAIEAHMRKHPLVVVTRAAPRDSRLATISRVSRSAQRLEQGSALRWAKGDAAKSGMLGQPIHTDSLDLSPGAEVWAWLEDDPLVVLSDVGKGVVATMGFHPSAARDGGGAATMLLRDLLVSAMDRPAAWLDFGGTMVLRMDDPGTAQNVHLSSFSYPELDDIAWASITDELVRRNARLSIGYCPGWVDDGVPGRGLLEVSGRPAVRSPGTVHASPQVRYSEFRENAVAVVHDYVSEFVGIQALRARGPAM